MPQKIIDTHLHIWNFDKAEYEWLKNNTSILNRTYDIDELEVERLESGISGGILVQAANNFEDTDWMLTVAAETDWIKGVVGWLPLKNPQATGEALEVKYGSNNYFKGVRHLIHDEPDAKWLLQPEVVESLQLLSNNKLPYDIVGIIPAHIETALVVAAKVPGLRMVFDHMNQPPISTAEKFGRWGELMIEASKNEKFYVKISGLGNCSKNENWTSEDICPYVEFVFKHFGVDRCMIGSDWPVSLLYGNYKKTFKAYKEVISSMLGDAEAEKVFYKNAEKFYNL